MRVYVAAVIELISLPCSVPVAVIICIPPFVALCMTMPEQMLHFAKATIPVVQHVRMHFKPSHLPGVIQLARSYNTSNDTENVDISTFCHRYSQLCLMSNCSLHCEEREARIIFIYSSIVIN